LRQAFPDAADLEAWVQAVERAQAEAEITFRKEWSADGFQKYVDSQLVDDPASPAWIAGLRYIHRIVTAHVGEARRRRINPGRIETFIKSQLLSLARRFFAARLQGFHPDLRRDTEQARFGFITVVTQGFQPWLHAETLKDWETFHTGTAPTHSNKTGLKKGPRPAIERYQQIFGLVQEVCPNATPREWRNQLKRIAAALDRAGVPVPHRWPEREPALNTWRDAREKDEGILIKVLDYAIRRGRPSD
jgi:hypothetical protein